ncbi:16S rRNA (cytidine(1402)-2'-O)-methyltransferase [Pigmentibacter sp. JX0631]|uniref:16S rRNA (cytidine(1402)-2'-O)-methyltransferase n=1 Tax=Pigmentibacter sp. JX0631 TaxID=2976982 RepID=UPI00246988C0|nr:16S rRNA (cytidine(1402)-2'-O)-methyltransferase [Pigmentibacter sp. JX0631]WGL58526.1 16S rRNA (cytidine(1402)-2'-O)-methyltransferase [Pigmentibacter sp. JX0631]
MKSGILYIVATPIGTLSDFSPRAKEVLSQVDFIACEDTRHTGKLLHYFSIKTPLESLHINNEKNKINFIINKLLNSENKMAAIVTDAGTPCISDPGSLLIAEAHRNNITIQSIPGPSSLTSALAACGFIQPRTIFSGFLDRTAKNQSLEYELWKNSAPCIAVIFESPKRILNTLKNLNDYFINDDIYLSVSKEISKKFEEHKIGTCKEILDYYSNLNEVQGEFVICININAIEKEIPDIETIALEAIHYSKNKNLSLKQACKDIALKYSINSKDIYNKALKL